jgi:hypothetical protein
MSRPPQSFRTRRYLASVRASDREGRPRRVRTSEVGLHHLAVPIGEARMGRSTGVRWRLKPAAFAIDEHCVVLLVAPADQVHAGRLIADDLPALGQSRRALRQIGRSGRRLARPLGARYNKSRQLSLCDFAQARRRRLGSEVDPRVDVDVSDGRPNPVFGYARVRLCLPGPQDTRVIEPERQVARHERRIHAAILPMWEGKDPNHDAVRAQMPNRPQREGSSRRVLLAKVLVRRDRCLSRSKRYRSGRNDVPTGRRLESERGERSRVRGSRCRRGPDEEPHRYACGRECGDRSTAPGDSATRQPCSVEFA